MARRLALAILSVASFTIAGFGTDNAAVAAITSGVKAVAFSPDGRLLASAYADGDIGLWNLATGHLHGPVLRVGSGGQAVNGVAFSPDGRLLASADANGTVQLWNPATGQPVGSVLSVGSGANGVAFSPDGRLLASADADGTIQWWTPTAGQPGGPDAGGWFVITACVIAIVLSALAVTLATREIRRARILRRPVPGPSAS